VFDGFEEAKDVQSRKRWFASTGTSVVIVIILGVGGVVLAKQGSSKPAPEQEIDVTFKASDEPEEKKAPPPPPPPPPKSTAPKAKRVGKVAPVQPTVIPEARPREATPTGPRAEGPDEPMEFGDGDGLGGEIKQDDLPPPPPPPPPPSVERDDVDDPDPISEVDPDFSIARPSSSNVQPVYPEKMRHKGVEAEVVLRVRISASGEVTKVDLVRGDEPFVAAAIAAVKTWRYSPATDAGKAVASTRLVKIPFRLHA